MTDYTPSEMKMNLRQLEKKLDGFRHKLALETDKDEETELLIAIENGESEARMWRHALGLPKDETGFAVKELLISICILGAIGYGVYWLINFISSL